MLIFKLLLSFALLCSFTACTSLPEKSVVKYAIDNKDAVVRIGTEPLLKGDHVGVFTETCREKIRRRSDFEFTDRTCTLNRVGFGEVAGVNPANDEATVTALKGTEFYKGLIVVKE